jgi:hypothetical protein
MVIWEWVIENREILSIAAAFITISGGSVGIVKYLPQIIRFLRAASRIIQEGVEKIRRGKKIEVFWRDFLKGPLVVVIPPRDADEEIFGTQSWDYAGKDDLFDELEDIFGRIDRDRSFADNLQQQEHNANIISVGGPIPNDVTAYLLNQPEVVYRFREQSSGKIGHKIVGESELNGELVFTPEYSTQQENIERDYGIITFVENPYNRDYDIICVCGGFGQGTYAGFQLLSDQDALSYIQENTGEYFQIIYTVKIDNQGTAGQPYLIDQHPDPEIQQRTLVQLYDQ